MNTVSSSALRPRRRPTWISVGVAALLFGIGWYLGAFLAPQPGPPATTRLAGPELDRRVLAAIDKIRSTTQYHLGFGPDWVLGRVEREAAAELLSLDTVRETSLRILESGTTAEKKKVADLLGRMQEPAAIPPLAALLDDPDPWLRETACYALDWCKAEGPDVEAKLVSLCRDDPSIGVRVWAAIALRGSHPDVSAATFRFGLQTGPRQLWELCENGLEQLGKLQLPLPEHIYCEVSPKEYDKIKTEWTVKRETEKDGWRYLEAVEQIKHALVTTSWFRTRRPTPGVAAPSKSPAKALADRAEDGAVITAFLEDLLTWNDSPVERMVIHFALESGSSKYRTVEQVLDGVGSAPKSKPLSAEAMKRAREAAEDLIQRQPEHAPFKDLRLKNERIAFLEKDAQKEQEGYWPAPRMQIFRALAPGYSRERNYAVVRFFFTWSRHNGRGLYVLRKENGKWIVVLRHAEYSA